MGAGQWYWKVYSPFLWSKDCQSVVFVVGEKGHNEGKNDEAVIHYSKFSLVVLDVSKGSLEKAVFRSTPIDFASLLVNPEKAKSINFGFVGGLSWTKDGKVRLELAKYDNKDRSVVNLWAKPEVVSSNDLKKLDGLFTSYGYSGW
jgi:hypothetical protein